MKDQLKSRAMERIAEKIIEQQVGLKPGRSLLTPMDYGECIRCVIDGLERSQEEITRLKAELEKEKELRSELWAAMANARYLLSHTSTDDLSWIDNLLKKSLIEKAKDL